MRILLPMTLLLLMPTSAAIAHPTIENSSYCWVELAGEGPVDLSGMCGGGTVVTLAPVVGGGSIADERAAILVGWNAAIESSPYDGQLRSDVTGGGRNPQVDARVYCNFKADGFAAAQIVLGIVEGQNYSVRDEQMELDYWTAIAAVGNVLLC